MKLRLHRVRRQFMSIGLAFLLIMMLIPHTELESIAIPVVQAQGGEPAITASDLQFDGSRYYYIATMTVSFYTLTWQLFLNNNTEYIVNEVVFLNLNVDASVFHVEPGGCVGFQNCAVTCNTCVAGLREACKQVAYAEAIVAGITIGGPCLVCIIGSTATVVGIPVALLCAIGCGLALGAIAAGIHAQYDICKAEAVGTCSSVNAPCVCKG